MKLENRGEAKISAHHRAGWRVPPLTPLPVRCDDDEVRGEDEFSSSPLLLLTSLSPPRAAYLLGTVIFLFPFPSFRSHRMSNPSFDGTSQHRFGARIAERATVNGSIDSVSASLHDDHRVSNREIPGSPGFGDVSSTELREESRAPNDALQAAKAFQAQHSGPQVDQLDRPQNSYLDEERVDREQTLPPSGNVSSTESQEFLDWKAAGRPKCSRCLKSHFGECKSITKWESDLFKRDPEGYARHRKRINRPIDKRDAYRNRVAKPKQRSQPPQPPRQRRETRGDQSVPDDMALSPFVKEFCENEINKVLVIERTGILAALL